MRLSTTIFLQEWLLLERQRWMPVSLLLFFSIALLSIFSGGFAVLSRLAHIDNIHAVYQ